MDSLKTLVPRVIEQSTEAQQKKSGKTSVKNKWNKEMFFEALKTKGRDNTKVANKIFDWCKTNANYIWWGEGKTMGSFVPVIKHKGNNHALFAVWAYGSIEIYFQWYQHREPFDSEEKRIELLNKLNSIEGVSLPSSSITKRSSIPLSTFTSLEKYNQLIDILSWVIDEITNS